MPIHTRRSGCACRGGGAGGVGHERRVADGGAARGARLGGMISVPAGVRVLLATCPVDFRKGAHCLAALATEALGEEPFSGAAIVCRAKRADRVKILLWDGSGLVAVWNHLQQGAFR